MPRPTTATLLLALVLSLGLGLGQITPRASAANNIHQLYLPLVACPTCTGQVVQPTPVTPTPVTPTPPPLDANANEARMIELVNQARVAAGCPAATPNAALMDATGAWSDYMNRTGDYSHGTFQQFQQKYAAYTGGVLENIANSAITSTTEMVYDVWYHSSLHYRNMVFCYHPGEPSYDPAWMYDIGVGYVDGYWTLAIGWRAP